LKHGCFGLYEFAREYKYRRRGLIVAFARHFAFGIFRKYTAIRIRKVARSSVPTKTHRSHIRADKFYDVLFTVAICCEITRVIQWCQRTIQSDYFLVYVASKQLVKVREIGGKLNVGA